MKAIGVAVGILVLFTAGNLGATETVVTEGEIQARLKWHGGVLVGEISAPTNGWMAIGFNRHAGLSGTHFLMAAPSGDGVRLEEHVAAPPTHAAIPTDAQVLDTWVVGKRRTILFAWPRPTGVPVCAEQADIGAQSQPGEMMLAFSVSPDFDHHSRVRKHVPMPFCIPSTTTPKKRRNASETLRDALKAYDTAHSRGTNLRGVLAKTLPLEELKTHRQQAVSASTFAERAKAAAKAGSSAKTKLAVVDGEIAIATALVKLPGRTVSDVLVWQSVDGKWRLTHKYYRVHASANGDR